VTSVVPDAGARAADHRARSKFSMQYAPRRAGRGASTSGRSRTARSPAATRGS
jgi:hypothetical protein